MTSRKSIAAASIVAALTLSGCDWFGSVTGTADTKMENVEIQPGTASDEMITLDAASGDGTAIDSSVAVGPPVPGAAGAGGEPSEGEAADPDAPVSSEDANAADAQPGDVVIRPPAGRAEGEPADKK